MADYTTVNHSYAGDSTNPRRYLAWVWDLVQSESDWFEIVESQGNWSDPANLGPGDYFVVKSKSNGWQALFALSGAAIGGYSDPAGGSEYPYLLADYLGKWSTTTHTFDGGSVDSSHFVRIDGQHALGTDNFSGFWTVFHYEDSRQSGVIIDGLGAAVEQSGAYYFGVSFYVGWLEAFEPISVYPYPFVFFAGSFQADRHDQPGYCPDGMYAGVQPAAPWWMDFLYEVGVSLQGRPVTLPTTVVEFTLALVNRTTPGIGYLPYIRFGDRNVSEQCSDDGTRYLRYGISWPISGCP